MEIFAEQADVRLQIQTAILSDHYVIDFYCPELKLAVEIDGGSHINPEQQKKDISRQKYLEAFDIKFVRIKDDELFGNPDKTFNKIEQAIKLIRKKIL